MGLRNLVTQLLRPATGQSTAPQQAKASRAGPVIAWSGVGQPKWTPRRFENLAEEGFRKNVIAYRCVTHIATASAAIPWLLYDDQGNELDSHTILTLLRHPNPLQDGVSFLENIYAHLEIAGNAYIEAVTPHDAAAPVELYVLRPDRMKLVPGPMGLPQAYQYTVNGQVTTWPADPVTGASNILHLKTFHPLDDWYGMPPMEAAAISIDQHNAAASWNQALLNQGARPSGALVFAPKDGPATLSDDQMRRLRDELGQLYQGQKNAGRPLILEGGLDWREMSLSPKDMDWLAGRNAAARDIALAFGVPAQLVGIPDSQTYANMAEARMALYEETILPLVTRVIAGFDHWLTPMFGPGLELDFDPDAISALSAKRDAQWSKVQNASFLTRNERREAVGYGPLPGGDAGDDDSDSDDPDPASSFGKYNHNHDELGRFAIGDGGSDGDTGSSDSEEHIGGFLQWAAGISAAHAQELDPEELRDVSEATPEAEIMSARYRAADETLRQLDPHNLALQYIAGPNWVPTEDDITRLNDAIASASNQRLVNFCLPNGALIGQPGNSWRIRELPGGLLAAQRDFEYLIPGATALELPSYRGIMMTLPGNNGLVGLRPESTSGPPALDITNLNVPFEKIHYP